MKNYIIIFLSFLFVNCTNDSNKVYLTEALEIIESNSIVVSGIDWEKIKTKAYETLEDKESTEDIHEIIKDVLKQLGDNHSTFISPSKKNNIANNNNRAIAINHKLIENNIGYINIPSFSGNGRLSIQFSKRIIEKITLLDDSNVQNWIIDLRGNTGGNMWPMLLGLSPLLEEGVAGYFIQKKDTLSWSLENGKVLEGNKTRLKFAKPYQLKTKKKAIAILVSNKTCSSAEAVVISFMSRPNVKIIGTETCGLTTSNSVFHLKDGSLLVLTTSVFADRNKNIFGKKIQPDISSNKPLEEALIWMNNEF
ncbi:S41 family peptidase [Kordia sp.]|uniref:S41 family peptidase n=1 Tax=Kordia sp. TaxID=1965332 RepID=UPI003D2DCF75